MPDIFCSAAIEKNECGINRTRFFVVFGLKV